MQIKAYTRNDDPYSQMLKNILQANNVAFENIEVSRDEALGKEMSEISGQDKTPVLVIGKKVYCGFDRELIKEVPNLAQNKAKE